MSNLGSGNTPALSRVISGGSRAGGILFGLIFAGLGTAFVLLVAHQAWNNAQTRRWNPVPCTIVQSLVTNNFKASNDTPYRALVRYRYTVAGHERMSAGVELNNSSFSTYDAAQDVVNRYPKGKTTTCFVDPHDPARAVLTHASLWPYALFVLLPLLFIGVGLATIFGSIRGRSPGGIGQTSISRSGRPAPILTAGFFALFLLIGIGVAFPTVINPLTSLMAAKKWPAVPCTILNSRVVTHHSSKSDTYGADVLYRYTFKGKIYHSSRYSPADISSSNFNAAKAIAARYRPGSTATCYINPANPQQAMLNRDWTWGNALIALVPLVFILVGAGGVFFSLRSAVRKRLGSTQSAVALSSGMIGDRTSMVPVDHRAGGAMTLRPGAGPMKKLLLAIGVAIFWNGIVSVFLHQAVSGWSRGHGDLCLSVFLVPFVIMGLGLIAWVGYQFLALFNPRPTLIIDHGAIPLGGSAQVKWSFMGRYDRISRLLLTIEAHEEATYRHGTTTSTDRHVFHRNHIADVTRPMEIYSGKATLAIPPGTMHTFTAPSNKIIWSLKIKGEIMGWPDVQEEFPIEVTPLQQ
jgi:hypothetical protein